MTFAEQIKNPISKKIVLFEYDEGLNIEEFISYEAGIYFKQFAKSTNATASSDYPLSYYYENQDTVDYTNIKSLKIGTENYTLVDSLAEMRLQVKSFYFDETNQIVYFRFDDDDPPLDKIVKLGIVKGFTSAIDEESADGCYYEDIYYEPRILKLPTLTKTKDPLFFGLLKYQNLNIDVINADGEYDDFTDRDVYGQATRFLFGFEGLDYADFVQLSAGYVNDPSWTRTSLTIPIQDDRKKLEREVPYNKFTQIEYPYLNDENVGKYKPIVYGYVKKGKAICLNEDEVAPTNNSFLFIDTEMDAAGSIDKVYTYFQDVLTDVTASVLNTDLDLGTFDLPHLTAFDATTSELKEVYVSFTGCGGLTNSMDIMKDIYENYGETAYLSSNFNTSEWASETIKAKDVGFYLDKPTKINKIFEEICKSVNGLWFIQDDGLITMRIYNPDRVVTKTIDESDWLDEPVFKKPVKEYLSSVIIQHSKDYQFDSSYTNYENTTYLQDALKKYKAYSQKTIKTFLTNETDAIAVSNNLMERSYNVLETVTRKTTLEHYDLKLMDIIIADHSRNLDKPTVYEIIGKSVNPIDFSITLTQKKIKDADYYIQGHSYGALWAYGEQIAYGSTEYIERTS